MKRSALEINIGIFNIVDKFNKLKTRNLIILMVFFVLGFILLAKKLDYQFATNYRTEFQLANLESTNNRFGEPFKGFLVKFELCLSNPKCALSSLESPDDVGNALLFWIGNIITPTTDILHSDTIKFRNPNNHPAFTRVLYILIHLFMIAVMTIIFNRTIGGFFSFLIGLSLCFFENLFFISLSNDVYFFPIYGLIILFVFFDINKFSNTECALFGILFGFLTWFRSGLLTTLLVTTSIFIFSYYYEYKRTFKTIIKKSFLLLFFSIFISSVPKLVFKSSAHGIWHSLHAGMYDFGGLTDVTGKVIPFHLIKSHPQKFENGTVHYWWADQIEYSYAQSVNPNIKLYSDEYEKILKNDYLNFWKVDPLANFIFYVKRIPRVFSFNPFKDHVIRDDNFTPIIIESIHSFMSYFLVFILLFIYFLKSKSFFLYQKTIVCSLLLMNSIPGILIHPGHTTYNAPLLFTQWLMIFLLLISFLSRFKGPAHEKISY